MLEVMERRNFPVASLRLLASPRSAGKYLKFRGETLTIEPLGINSFEGIDIALFSAGSSVVKEYAPVAVKSGAVVIDNSSAFRAVENVPLVVPEINGGDVKGAPGRHRQPELHHGDHAHGAVSAAQEVWREEGLRFQLPGRVRSRARARSTNCASRSGPWPRTRK